ncbi:MAG: M48 family metalloprotease [Fimbriimonadaceae bacterium]|nr:M48 family metalloprotease [Fimbriimonadaceae bacterium]QYK54837.1 MAG: M48 family metalloprotease [Fimbriimonadaceae bacterium]
MTLSRLIVCTTALSIGMAGPAQADLFRPSIKDQIALGKRGAADVRKKEKVLGDSDPRVQELRRIGNKLVGLIPQDEKKKRPFEYTFDVIDSPDLNAFAMPGGPIFFYTGLLNKFKTEDEVAGVLAHEITHVRNQHWASAYADNQKRRLGIGVVLTLLGAGDTAFDVASVADTLIYTLPYSRKHETEADKWGYDLTKKAGFNPGGMVDAFEVLRKGGGGGTPEFLSTHPNTGHRIDELKKRVANEANLPPMTSRSSAILTISASEEEAQAAKKKVKK